MAKTGYFSGTFTKINNLVLRNEKIRNLKSMYYYIDGIGLKLNINEDDNALDIDLVMLTAEYYLISEERAEEIKNEVVNAVKQWRTVAKKHQASESEIALKSPAFNIITNYISS